MARMQVQCDRALTSVLSIAAVVEVREFAKRNNEYRNNSYTNFTIFKWL